MMRTLLLLLLLTTGVSASAEVSYREDVLPILARRCFACHGPDEAAGSLDLSSSAGAAAETDSGERAIVSGDPEASEIMVRITSDEDGYRMPEDGDPLEQDEIAVLRRWIAEGGVYEGHWGFEAVDASVQPPSVTRGDWPRQPVDRFVLHKLERAGLEPAGEADPATLVRRLYHDLIGLPPTPEQVRAYLQDGRADRYERLVDELLGSPHYGERWARHWLDVVRFAETNSFERDGEKKNAFTYRDYVIESFNEDRPYDDFLRHQLAGDEIVDQGRGEYTDEDRSMLAATGFLRLGLWDDEPADPTLHLFDQYDDIVRTVSEGMLGLTVGCARCHDHKIDPIPQSDYYELVAFFRDVPGFGTRHDKEAYNQIDVSSASLRDRYAKLSDELQAIASKMRVIEQRGIEQMPGPDQRASETRRRPQVLKKLDRFLSDEDRELYASLKADKAALDAELRELPARKFVLGVTGTTSTPPKTRILERGSPEAPADVVTPGYPNLLSAARPSIPAVPNDALSAGRRRVFADWIASNPDGATARVMVNRIWQHHFGRGLVRSANNFGQLGTPPTHPKLLDWLATRFVQEDWSIKAMHRLIVTSATYRMATTYNPEAARLDPANDLYWRQDIRRMDAEEVRDAILSVCGAINLDRIGGPSVYPIIEDEVLAGLSKPGVGWGKSSDRDRNRRSLYVFSKRSLPLPLFSAFDFPETDATCEGRFQTVQAAQALSLLNSRFLEARCRELAGRLAREAGRDRDDRIRLLLRLAYSRPPTDAEVQRFIDLVHDLEDRHGQAPSRAMELVCLAVLNTSEFLYID